MSEPRLRSATIAHVGGTGSDDDRDRWLAARIWLGRNDRRFLRGLHACRRLGTLRRDVFDLNGRPPRDFLAEAGRADLVIVHHLWGYPDPSRPEATGPTACSPRHGAGAWRDRLGSTEARYIFLFGPHFNAAHLGGPLGGYDVVSVPILGFLDVLAARAIGLDCAEATRAIGTSDLREARLRGLAGLGRNRVLDLSHTRPLAADLARVGAMGRLEALHLVGTSIADGDLDAVARCRRLRVLNLDETAITDAGLGRLGRLRRLVCLSLNDTAIGDDGLRHLRGLARLEWLSLVGTAIGDTGLDHLKGLAGLRTLSLVGTRATAPGVERLRHALSDCTIDHASDEE